ncbi:MAG: ATP synthase F1 subunit gamma [Candidatus Wildermuthbacteria bacterium RIFCSPHIGHO2_01_FULL_45_20]|uniref:ATP synthase F1 subunit gamma n=1 Tax=Candidatus Wildermuthbacteria bacterium RIFCSPHIGHO2_02_FULL_45_25 TaxID=1802450 RepID=A0A1G2R442_9BACT|nr:MAG: ATP synthase F1 subunit gamma [Candidatus Wildermuthbacteria bacterium RIFCSPHIGHO2_01_FULL_45_20]OHA67497.1 MAG: ATP synthase F1 subunit gamma [Candidatus Wildermuthbacteria bacterium RIFCSPHIGHO2_02_FULL_45_25]
MQMVAATKMRKAQESALRARPYAKKSFALLLHLLGYAEVEGYASSYITKVGTVPTLKTERIAFVVVTSDKGLAGSFNSAVLRLASRWKKEAETAGSQVEIVAVGKRGRDFFKSRGSVIAAEFFQFSDIVTFSDVAPVINWILEAYDQKRYDNIVFCSTQFVSALTQKPEIHQILPLEKEELAKIIEGIVPKTGRYSEIAKQEQADIQNLQYILEPSAQEIFQTVVRDLVKVAILHLIYESNASEHSARMIAMKNATENAGNLIETLNLELNKSRQAAITQELTEISTAKEALTSE